MTASRKLLYGVVHIPALPGTPFHRSGTFPDIVRGVLDQAQAMSAGGMDGALLQTVDRVYSVQDSADPARVAAMSILAHEVRNQSPTEFAVGVQIMRHAVSASLAVAKLTGASFVRADAIVGATLSTHGWVEPDPLQIMTYRKTIEAMDVDLIADIDSMHYQWAGVNESTGGVAKRALTVGADAVCIAHPDTEQTQRKVTDIRQRTPGARIMLGGFVDHENAAKVLADADGAFVSGCLVDKRTPDRVDVHRVQELVQTVRGLA
ncbi:BtpA/SgcQ family protein [Nocardia sp. NPDC058114]|uniref:BtpA/SgcQ family protein n=1 Tax=Nocardia sp. NPDC058114 TaxID=3346346 RepID=UPI0036DD09B5